MSLTELMVSITVSSLLLAMAATLIGLLMRAEGRASSEDLAATETARLARQFRRDVHAARGVAPAPDQPDAALLVDLQLATGQRVAYRLTNQRIQRIERGDGNVTRRDSFTLLPGTQARVQRLETPEGLLELVLQRGAASSAPAVKKAADREDRGDVLRIEAVLGRDGRFAGEVPDAR